MPTDDEDPRQDDGISERRHREPDRPRRRRRRDEDDEDDERDYRSDYTDQTGGLIPYKNGWALVSYYCGVFALIPCVGGALGIFAVVFGFLGLSHARLHPESKGTVHAIIGITLGILVVLFHLVVFGLMAMSSRW